MTLPTLDTHEFTRRGDAVEGEAPVRSLERLATLLADASGALAWRLEGRSEVGADGSRRPFLDLAFSGRVRMHCVRCLEPVDVALDEHRAYRLVATEEQAEREDADEEEVDLLVSSRRFELGVLLEDEAIMALPPAPSHEDCRAPALPAEPADVAAGSPSRPSPFAALRAVLPGGGQPAGAGAGEGGTGGEAAGGPAAAPGSVGGAADDPRPPGRRGR